MDAGVYSAAVAKVWLMDGADNAWIFLLVFICDLGCSVLGSIVNYKDLYFISAWLMGFDAVLHISFRIITWNCYTQ